MKPTSEMSDQELNEAISLFFEAKPTDSINGRTAGVSKLGYWQIGWLEDQEIKWLPREWSTSWLYAGPLLEEIIDNFEMVKISIVNNVEWENNYHHIEDLLRLFWKKSDCLPRKISEAWYTMKGGVE